MAPHAVLDLHSILSNHLIAADEVKKGGRNGVSEIERGRERAKKDRRRGKNEWKERREQVSE